MTDQLVLIDIVPDIVPAEVPADKATAKASWHLDPATCEIGRRGVARARKALQATRTPARTDTVPSPDLPAAA